MSVMPVRATAKGSSRQGVQILSGPDHCRSEWERRRPRAPGAFWGLHGRKSCWWEKGAGEQEGEMANGLSKTSLPLPAVWV